jgi:hypothetical protein
MFHRPVRVIEVIETPSSGHQITLFMVIDITLPG